MSLKDIQYSQMRSQLFWCLTTRFSGTAKGALERFHNSRWTTPPQNSSSNRLFPKKRGNRLSAGLLRQLGTRLHGRASRWTACEDAGYVVMLHERPLWMAFSDVIGNIKLA